MKTDPKWTHLEYLENKLSEVTRDYILVAKSSPSNSSYLRGLAKQMEFLRGDIASERRKVLTSSKPKEG